MKRLFAVMAVTLISFACSNVGDQSGIYESEKAKFYDGDLWTWVKLDGDGNPVQAAIAINDMALNSLPMSANAMAFSKSVKFNERAAKLPFTHAYVDWNPHGHDPLFAYGAPHFDFHFYIMPDAQRMLIPPYDVDSAKFKNAPAADYFPPNYINPGGGVPQMGAHWVDVTSPELSQTNPQPFTQTFIYGSYDGKVIFYEPMITLDFIKNTPTFERSIPQPAKFQTAGYYPTRFRLMKQMGYTEVILDNFVYRQAS